MSLIQCNSTLSVGIRQFDEEHCHLVDIFNRFHSTVKSGDSNNPETLENTLNELAEFANSHFAHEEEVLELHGYPELAQHRAAHSEIMSQLVDTKAKLIYGSSTLQYELLQFLLDWLMNHTREMDKQYSTFLKSKGVT